MEGTLAVIQYYAREKYWHHIIDTCQEELRRGPDPILLFWKAFGVFNEGNPTEAIRDLGTISQRREASYAACIAQIYYHKQCRLVDEEAVTFLKAQKLTLQSSAPDVSLLLAAQFLSLVGKHSKAKQVVSEVLERNQANLQAINVYAWAELLDPTGDHSGAERGFDQVIDDAGDMIYTKFVDTVMGKVKYCGMNKNFNGMIAVLNDLLVRIPKYVPGLIEKAKAMIMIGAWDELVEAAQRVLMASPKNIEALRIWAFHAIAREASYDVATEKLTALQAALRAKEPKNASLYISIAKPLARISGRRKEVIQQTLSIIQEAKRIKPDDSEVLIELGEELIYLGDFTAAIKAFTDASQKDEANMLPIYKMIYCKVLQEQYFEASQQMEFLLEIEESTGRSSELTFLKSMLTWRRDGDKKEAIKLLDEALSLHVATTKNLSPGMEFYAKLNPDYLLQIAKEYLQYFGLKSLPKTEKPPHYLVRAAKLLETITKQIPGIIECHLLLAKAKFISNEFQASQRYISIALQLDPDCIDALILLSLISLQTAQYLSANSALEQAVARNFAIRENPMFALVKGQVEIKQQRWQEALKTFESAINLPGVRSGEVNRKLKLFLTISQEDRATIFADLALCYAETGNLQEATRVMAEAIGEFTGTSAEITIVIANSEIALKKGDVKQSLNILKGISSDHPNYKDAQVAMAEIYLNHMFNRRLYAKCYYDILSTDDSVENYLLLGEALMRIQEPEEAIKVYEKALRFKPDDLFLTREIGRALVLTHEYQRAIQYYESAVRSDPRKSELLIDLAKLYMQLKDFSSASLVLDQVVKGGLTDIPAMRRAAQGYLLQGKVQLQIVRADDPMNLMPLPNAAAALESSKNIQKDILSNSRDLPPEQIEEERKRCSEVLYELAQYYQQREQDLEKSRGLLIESLTYDEMNSKAILSLARLFEKLGDQQSCLQFCNRMIRIDPSNEEATTMMAEQLLLQNKVEEARACYKRLLENQTDQYRILSKLLTTLERSGKILDFEPILEQATKSKAKNTDAGYSYCLGIYKKKLGRLNEALENLYKARNDSVYGERALENMIELYLNPDNDIFWSRDKILEENVRSASSLIKELQSKTNNLRITVLNCLVHIAKGTRESIELSSNKISDVLGINPQYVPAIIAFAISKGLTSKYNEARVQLENLAKIPFQSEFAEDFEKGWLMLAQIYMNGKNYPQASELLIKTLRFNQGSSKAKELLGIIKESENDLKAATLLYENAWKTNKSADSGYRLAAMHLRSKRLVDAIEVSREVLSLYPKFPDIKKNIFDKAVELIRP